VKLHGIVVAAGSGTRFGGPKAQVALAGRPLWQWARDALVGGGALSVVVVGDVAGGIRGGARRRDSVAAGLDVLPVSATHVLVHDAARPLASPDLVRQVIARLERGDVAGVVPAVPVRDTIKRLEGDLVIATLERFGLVAVQTPQAFALEALRHAHGESDEDSTDDAALVERAGGAIAVVAGDPANLKITYPEDLEVAERMIP